MNRPRLVRRALHGVLLFDKPVGLSSNDALQHVKRLFRAEKAGHTGTLDPLASGLLPICFGAATKFSHASLGADKGYRATLRLGVTTTTGDGEGTVVDERPVQVDRAAVVAACSRFLGASLQTPPMYSALKHNGRALYAYAREGADLPRAPRPVTVRALDVVGYDGTALELDITCGKGTYIRTLAEDLGRALGCGAHLSALRRTAVGRFGVEHAVTLEALQGRSEAQRDELVRDVDCLLAEQPAIHLNDSEAARFLTGLRRRVELRDAAIVRVYGPPPQRTTRGVDADVFLGSAHVAGGELIADRLLSPLEIQTLVRT